MTDRLAIDSSAIVAIINREPEALGFLRALTSAEVFVGAPTLLEVRLWLVRRPGHTEGWLTSFLNAPETSILPFDAAHEPIAAEAALRFGKGRHPARLNFGDCMAYAIAMQEGVPLLFKGGDFGRTDVRVHSASVVTVAL